MDSLPDSLNGLALFSASIVLAGTRRACGCKEPEAPKRDVFNIPCTVSAPGKVLLAGGYLVLEPENIGITIAGSARFYTSIAIMNGDSAPTPKCLKISVISPQFYSTFDYTYSYDVMDLKLDSTDGNAFVAKCLSLVLLFAKEWFGADFTRLMDDFSSRGVLAIKLQADNDFYSHIKELKKTNKPLLSSSLNSIPRLSPCHRDPKTGEVEVSKTGMGSSAALTTSLVGALLHALGIVDVEATAFAESRRIVHNLSQLAHCIAQGKIGSGFDVSAAVYGSQIYCRFDAKQFNLDDVASSGSKLYSAVMDVSRWTQSADKFALPRGMGLIMADVCGGSSSSSMARGVLAWRAKQSDVAMPIWSKLAAANIAIRDSAQTLHQFADIYQDVYNRVIDYACTCKFDSEPGHENHFANVGKLCDAADAEHAWGVWSALLDLKTHFGTARALLREMGERSGQDIEPSQQKELADATESVPGVLCAGVPGAGGVDAMYAIVFSSGPKRPRDVVEGLWSKWNQGNAERSDVCALTLEAEGEKSGVVLEPYSPIYY